MAFRKPLVQIDGSLQELPAADTLPPSAMGSGSADPTTFLRGDGTWSVPPSGGGGVATIPDFLLHNNLGVL